MKKELIAIFFFISAHVSAQKSANKIEVQAPDKLLTASDTLQYSLGAYVAQWINTNGFLISNASLFLKGMDDMFQSKPRLIPDSIIGPVIVAHQLAIQKERGIRQEQKLFASLKDKSEMGILPSGVQYHILKKGKGNRPTEKDSLVINMITRLADGKIVDDTYKTKKPFVTTISALFAGLSDPLQLMTEGSIWQIFIPSALAYGDKGTTLIPPNSALILEVELVEVRSAKK